MPTPDPLTATQYLLFVDMISRIRTLEHVATQHFLRGNSNRRIQIANDIRSEVATPPNPVLSASDHRRFNEIVIRLRTFEQIATTNFFSGNSERAGIVNAVKTRVASVHSNLFSVQAGDGTVAGRCSFPYCASSAGTCELCGADQIQQRLFAAAALIDQDTAPVD